MIQRETSGIDARKASDVPSQGKHGPVRTCVGCRKRELAVVLLRVVAESDGNGGNAVIVDTAGNLPGRGAWLHPDPPCVHAAIRRRAFARALRITRPPDTSAVVEYVGALPGADVPDPPRSQTMAREQAAKNMSTP